MDDLGQVLRQARESKGISLEVAEEETKIRRKYLEALETGQYTDLPGEVYLKGFLRTYGNYLELDGASLVDQYKEQSGGRRNAPRSSVAEAAVAAPAPERPAVAVPAPAAVLPDPDRVERRTREYRERRASASRARVLGNATPPVTGRTVTTVIVIAAALAVIGYLGWLIAAQFSVDAPPASAPAPVNTITEPPPTTAQPVVSTPAPLPDPPKVTMSRGAGNEVLFAVPAKEVTVRVEIPGGERVWIQAFVDGNKASEAIITNAVEFKGAKVRIQMGHMNGVSVVVNGQRFERPLDGGPYWLNFNGQ